MIFSYIFPAFPLFLHIMQNVYKIHVKYAEFIIPWKTKVFWIKLLAIRNWDLLVLENVFKRVAMPSVNTTATHKFIIILNEKAPPEKLLSATGQTAMSLYWNATKEQQVNMSFVPFLGPSGSNLITVSTCSFVVLKSTANQLLTLFAKTTEQNLLSAIFTSTMSFNGIEEDLILKTASTPLDQTGPYGVGIFGSINEINPLTKKFSIFK